MSEKRILYATRKCLEALEEGNLEAASYWIKERAREIKTLSRIESLCIIEELKEMDEILIDTVRSEISKIKKELVSLFRGEFVLRNYRYRLDVPKVLSIEG